jgi:DNA-binding XRE family transcriptional regulator
MRINKVKAERLKKAGWKIGTVDELLGLSAEESALIEMKLSLATSLKHRRIKQGKSQTELAKALGSSQSRVAKMEAADASVSLELMVQALLKIGVSRQEIGRIIGQKSGTPAA